MVTRPTLRSVVPPVTLAVERTIPVDGSVSSLLPGRSLPRGGLVCVDGRGATSLAIAMLSASSRAGCWVAVVGVPSLGWAAVEEKGWDLRRTVTVPSPEPGQWAVVVAQLIEAVDVVVVAPKRMVTHAEARRFAARRRQAGSVVLSLSDHPGVSSSAVRRWPIQPDVVLRTSSRWEGLGQGSGVLRAQRVHVEVDGRRDGAPVRHSLRLAG